MARSLVSKAAGGVVKMSADAPTPADSGIEVLNLLDDLEFAGRRLHTRDLSIQMEGLRRLTRAFVDKPEAILQELVNAALDLCGADSAGISIEQANPTDENFYVWVATAGRYASFSNATLPRFPSACGICLERGRPQRFRVFQRFFDLMDIDAAVVTDGILLPWLVDEVRHHLDHGPRKGGRLRSRRFGHDAGTLRLRRHGRAATAPAKPANQACGCCRSGVYGQ
jgi:hypothetical protein